MAKKKSRRERAAANSPLDSTETRAAESFTVAWMLAVITTLVCQITGWITLWLLAQSPGSTGLGVLAWLLLFAAVAIGLLSLLLAAVVLRTRREPPPRVITVGSLAIGVMPLVALFWG